MPPPEAPFIPGTRLPRVREVDATSGAPHTPPAPRPPQPSNEHFEVRGRGWSASIPTVAISTAVTALVMHFTQKPAVQQDDPLRRDIRDVATDVRAAQQSDRETRSRQELQETATNALRAEMAGMKAKQDVVEAKVDKLTRLVEEQAKR